MTNVDNIPADEVVEVNAVPEGAIELPAGSVAADGTVLDEQAVLEALPEAMPNAGEPIIENETAPVVDEVAPAAEETPAEPISEEPASIPEPLFVTCPLTFEQYFRRELVEVKAAEFMVNARFNEAGDIVFYIRPYNKDGLTRDFKLCGEQVQNVTLLQA